MAEGPSAEYGGFAARYAAMSDGELLKLASQSWALSDAACDALEDEIDKRRLEIPEPEALPAIEIAERRNLVLLRRFRDVPEALLAKGKLDSAGVECFLADDNMVRMDWFISNLLGGVKLLVDPEEFTDASRLLNESFANSIEEGWDEDLP
jgi:Putative prokaryotic signal transducing protein